MRPDTFADLLTGHVLPTGGSARERSRFALGLATNAAQGTYAIACMLYELFAGMVE